MWTELHLCPAPPDELRLQGACGSCPSSTMTLKMGVAEVVQVL
jgi:Fe-S cluster biogenesis protein NfuA